MTGGGAAGGRCRYAGQSPPDPRILDMARSGAGGEQDDIDADVVTRTRIARHQDLGGGSDAGEAAFVDGEVEFRSGAPGLHLDERQH